MNGSNLAPSLAVMMDDELVDFVSQYVAVGIKMGDELLAGKTPPLPIVQRTRLEKRVVMLRRLAKALRAAKEGD